MSEKELQQIENEFQPVQQAPEMPIGLMGSEAMKQVAEVQAKVMMAKRFPRDRYTAFNDILDECGRKALAEQAVYSYPRGGKNVSGPSIRLAEVLARAWGNVDFGYRVLESDDDKSVLEAYAWDMEKNSRTTRVFEVPHVRHTRERSYKLTDSRDIYELEANMAARRIRACILQLIPGDVTDKAMSACKKTVTTASGEPLQDRILKILTVFRKFGVNQGHIEDKLGHGSDTIDEEELFDLMGIYNALKDGTGKRSQYFNIADTEKTEKTENLKEKLK